MDVLKALNLALSFVLELCMLAALGYWGFQTGVGTVMQVVLGIGAPLLAAVIWGLLLAPKAVRRLSGAPYWGLKVVVFGVAAVALAAAGQTTLALIFAVAVLVNTGLNYAWKQG